MWSDELSNELSKVIELYLRDEDLDELMNRIFSDCMEIGAEVPDKVLRYMDSFKEDPTSNMKPIKINDYVNRCYIQKVPDGLIINVRGGFPGIDFIKIKG